MRFVPSINLHQLQLSLLTSIDLEYESYTHSLQMDALIMNSLTYGFGLSVHLISYVFGFSLLIMKFLHFRLRNRQKYSLFTAYVEALYFFEFNHFSNINGFF